MNVKHGKETKNSVPSVVVVPWEKSLDELLELSNRFHLKTEDGKDIYLKMEDKIDIGALGKMNTFEAGLAVGFHGGLETAKKILEEHKCLKKK